MNQPELYRGVVVPTVSPFTVTGDIDEQGVEKLITHLVDNHCHPFVLGTTGESLSIPLKNKVLLLDRAVKTNRERRTLYAGIGSMCFKDSIDMGNMFLDRGADVVVAHLPSYYPMNHYQMLTYFEELANHLNGPLIIYNITSTTHMSIPPEVIEKLSYHERIIGTKDSERDLERLDRQLEMFKDRKDFVFQLGWATRSSYMLQNGGDGIVPSTANLVPDLYYELYLATQEQRSGDAEKYQAITDEISTVYQKERLLSEALPGLKQMLSEIGICEPHCISPCYPLKEEWIEEIQGKVLEIRNKGWIK